MILVIEQAMDLQALPPEPAHCSLEQALRNMDWPFPVQTAAAATPSRPQRKAATWLQARFTAPTPAPAAVRPAVAEPLPMLEYAAAC